MVYYPWRSSCYGGRGSLQTAPKRQDGAVKASTRWFGWITVILVLHTGDQLICGLQGLSRLKRAIAAYDGWFQNAELATVFRVTLGALLI